MGACYVTARIRAFSGEGRSVAEDYAAQYSPGKKGRGLSAI